MTPTALLVAAFLAPAADPKPEDIAKADQMIHSYLRAETERLSKNFLDGAKTKAEWEAKRPKLQEQFLDMLGLWPLPEKTPLKATVTGTLERGDVVIEKLHFQSRPGLYVTANLYRPKASRERQRPESSNKLPAILYVCGHNTSQGRSGNKVAYQDHGLWFASNGYVCLMVDTLQLGEIAGIHHGTYRENRWWWHSRGYTPAGVECWNGIRAIDYLCTRPDVDPEKIGVTGISGGGATTVWVAATDDRVKVAVPVSGMSDLESYVTNKVVNGHCDCMFSYNPYQWEWTTILALFAPKPLLFANSDNDSIFPMDGNRRIIARLRQCYEMLGKPDNVDEHVSKGGHAYRPDLRIAIYRFINQHLKGEVGEVKDADFPMIDGKELRVFPEDSDLPKDAINAKADEVFVPKADVKLPEKPEEFKAWKAGLVKQLREKSFRAIPEASELQKNLDTSKGEVLDYSHRRETIVKVETEPGVAVGVTYLPARADWRKTSTWFVLNPDEDRKAADVEAVREASVNDVRENSGWFGPTSHGLYPRGSGPFRWTRKNPPNTIERSLVLLGQTTDSGRVRDVMTLFHGGKERTKEQKMRDRLVGRGPAGVIAAYAALLNPGSTDEVVIIDPPTSHRDGPHFLNVMRVLDIPDALGLLAPDVKLTLIGAKDKAFDKTAAIYKLAGAADKFERK
jgi:dienelactone hydrolase